MMDFPRLDYKGYTILAKPDCGTDGKWFGGYEILKDDRRIAARSKISPSFLYADAACADSIELAKLEIDARAAGSDMVH